MHIWTKICGTTCLDDALVSIDAGADALGFIFSRSTRQVSLSQAEEIISKLKEAVAKIGVFQNASTEQVCHAVTCLNLTGIQLHGNESAEEIYRHLPESGRDAIMIIKTVLVSDGWQAQMQSAPSTKVSAWLLDSGAGSGKTFDWAAVRPQTAPISGRVIVAGGLSPANVGSAIEVLRPWGVDVVTGVEQSPGKKDHKKVAEFLAAVRKAEQT